jgi:hypothetical protein
VLMSMVSVDANNETMPTPDRAWIRRHDLRGGETTFLDIKTLQPSDTQEVPRERPNCPLETYRKTKPKERISNLERLLPIATPFTGTYKALEA